jgi:ABC-type uncharacterized transport system involved in gliding motility auxiliary subunit
MVTRILNIVGWIGTGLVLAALAVRFLRPEWDRYAVYAAWGGLACLVLYALGQWREVVTFFKRRNARYGAIASLSVLVVLGILVAVNYLSARQNKRWDLTSNKQFTPSDQTIKLLKGLDAPVKFMVFDKEDSFEQFRTRLTEYEYQSNHKVSTEYIDADKRPVQAKQYNVETYGTIVIQYKDRTERVTSNSEQDLTNGLIKVLTGAQKKVYFVQGHGEKDIAASDRTGYNAIVSALGSNNYSTEKLVLAQAQDVPTDAAVVVIAGLRTDLLKPEVDMLSRYLNKGGHVFMLLDPPEASDSPTPQVEALLKDWGVELGNNVVVDASGMGQLIGTDASVPVAATYPGHPIVDRFNLLTAYPLARSVGPTPTATNGRVAMSFIQTSPRSWAETNLAQMRAKGEVALNVDQGDKPGPVSIGAAVAIAAPEAPPAEGDVAKASTGQQPPKPETRLAVIGDSDFAANYALGIQGNRDLFVNAVNWLAQQENLIAIQAREPEDRRITMTAQQTNYVFLMSILVIPGLVFAGGIYTWWRRR